MAKAKKETNTGDDTIIVVNNKHNVFSAFRFGKPKSRFTGMSWEDAVKNLWRSEGVVFITRQSGEVFKAFFGITPLNQGYGLSEGSAIKDLFVRCGVEIMFL